MLNEYINGNWNTNKPLAIKTEGLLKSRKNYYNNCYYGNKMVKLN